MSTLNSPIDLLEDNYMPEKPADKLVEIIAIACSITQVAFDDLISNNLKAYEGEIEKLEQHVKNNENLLSEKIDVQDVLSNLNLAGTYLRQSKISSSTTIDLTLNRSFSCFNNAKNVLDITKKELDTTSGNK